MQGSNNSELPAIENLPLSGMIWPSLIEWRHLQIVSPELGHIQDGWQYIDVCTLQQHSTVKTEYSVDLWKMNAIDRKMFDNMDSVLNLLWFKFI